MKYYWLIALSSLFFISCNNIKRRKVGNYIVEAKFISDSIIDGEATFYNLDGSLASIENYKVGVKDGVSLAFHSNGRVYDSVLFINGLRSGYHYVYDSSGKLGYVNYYSNGYQIGPEMFYKNGVINAYSFSSFDKFNLFYMPYDSSGKHLKYEGNITHSNFYETSINGKEATGIFAYFIHPQKLKIDYELVLRDSLGESTIMKFESNEVFIDTVVAKAPTNYEYRIKAIMYDSLDSTQKDGKIYYDDVKR